jgi:acetyl-CoA acetyltransferase
MARTERKPLLAGEVIGVVQDVEFEPDTGNITAVFYDEFDLPFPRGSFTLLGVPLDGILAVTAEAVVIDTRYVWVARAGAIDAIGSIFRTLRRIGGSSESTALVQARQQAALQEWEIRYGMTADEYARRYMAAPDENGLVGLRREKQQKVAAPDPRRRVAALAPRQERRPVIGEVLVEDARSPEYDVVERLPGGLRRQDSLDVPRER